MLLVAHPATMAVAAEAAKAVGLSQDRILLVGSVPESPFPILDDMVALGLSRAQQYTEMRLKPGEAKKKVALLLLSSGTTGKPKVSDIIGVSRRCR